MVLVVVLEVIVSENKVAVTHHFEVVDGKFVVKH